MAEQTVKTRILILSDTHCASLGAIPSSGFKRPLPAADLAIHCGDLTITGEIYEYHKALDVLKEIDAPVKLVIAGNHDLTLDRDFLLGHLNECGPVAERAEKLYAEARNLWTAGNARARSEGVTFLDEGTHTVELPNGASVYVYASPFTPKFCDFAFPYEKDEDRYNPPVASLSDAKNICANPIPTLAATGTSRPIDIMVTHGPPYGRMDATDTGELTGCPHLLRALMRARPLLHCFGHIHEGRGAERVQWTENARRVAVKKAVSTAAWREGYWKEGVKEVKNENEHEWGFGGGQVQNAAVVSASKDSGTPLRRGEETLLVNASIMDVGYHPTNAAWLVTLDLPAWAIRS